MKALDFMKIERYFCNVNFIIFKLNCIIIKITFWDIPLGQLQLNQSILYFFNWACDFDSICMILIRVVAKKRGAGILTQCNLTHVFWPTSPCLEPAQGLGSMHSRDQGRWRHTQVCVWLSEVESSASQVSYTV